MASKFVSIDGTLHFRRSGKLEIVPPALEQKLLSATGEFFRASTMTLPSNPKLPFFAYGLFKPGQLGFDSIRAYSTSVNPAQVSGVLYEKDGVPLFANGNSDILGALIMFSPDSAHTAYNQIAVLEPGKLYKWETRT